MKQGWSCRGARAFSKADDEYVHNDSTWNNDNEYWQESIRLFDKLASSASDEKIKTYSKQNLIYLYRNIGKYEEAVNIANTFPEMCICKENLLYHATDGKNHCKYAQEALLASLRSVKSALIAALISRTRFGKAHSKLKIEKITGLIELYELIFDDRNMGFEHSELRDLYLIMINDYNTLADTDDQSENKYYTDKIFECLDKALYHSRRFDELIKSGIYKHSSYLVNHISENTDDWIASPGTSNLSESWQLFDFIKKRLSADPRWNEWVEKTLENTNAIPTV